MSDTVIAFIANQRKLLSRLERFAETPSYARLLKEIGDFASEDPEAWLLHWLVQPMWGCGRYRVEVAEEPDGTELLLDQVLRIVSGAYWLRVQADFVNRGEAAIERWKQEGAGRTVDEVMAGLQGRLDDAKRRAGDRTGW